MTVIDNVRALIYRLALAPICDDCQPQDTQTGGSNGFERGKDI